MNENELNIACNEVYHAKVNEVLRKAGITIIKTEEDYNILCAAKAKFNYLLGGTKWQKKNKLL